MEYIEKRDYAIALTYYEKALDIEKRILPTDNYRLAMVHYNMSRVYNHLNQYDVAVKHAEHAVQFVSISLRSNHEDFLLLKKNFEQLRTKL